MDDIATCSPSLRDAVIRSSLVAFFIDQIAKIDEEHDMFRSKPTAGSVCGGICRALPFIIFN